MTHGQPEQYLSWEDLLESDSDVEEALHAPPLGVPDFAGSVTSDSHGLPKDVPLPPDLQAMLAEKERLEDQLKQLTGAGEPKPEDERQRRMFPVRVHTVETRIEERRLRKRDEHLRMLKQRALEARLTRKREQARQAELAAEITRKALQRKRAILREQWQRAEALAELRRRAIAQRASRRREEERRASVLADQKRRALEQSLIASRLEARHQERVREQVQEESLRAATETRWHQGRAIKVAEHQQERKVSTRRLEKTATTKEERLQAFMRERKLQQQQAERPSYRPQASMRHSGTIDSRELNKSDDDSTKADINRVLPSTPPRFDHAQRRREAQAWEQKQDRLREQALARRLEERMTNRRLDKQSRRDSTDR